MSKVLLPVHPLDRHLLAMDWDRSLYIDTCLPFGLNLTPKLFNVQADLLSWILTQKGILPVFHYLNDFLILGPPRSSICANNLATIKEVCSFLGIPLALEKVEGPFHSLGITLDTQQMMPNDKLKRIRNLLAAWLKKMKATKSEILSLVYRPVAGRHKSGKTWTYVRGGLFNAINKGSSKESVVMHLLRCLFFLSA